MVVVYNSDTLAVQIKPEKGGVAVLHKGKPLLWLSPRDIPSAL
jgi:hypothetical protein